MRIVLFCAALVAVMPVIGGCAGPGAAGGDDTVVAAFYPIAFAAERIAGPKAEVRNLTPAGAEPHDLELGPRDIITVREAALVLYLGGDFMPGLGAAVDERSGRSVDLRAGLEIPRELARDQHVWLDPVAFAAMSRAIGVALDARPAAERFAQRLERLDAAFRRGLSRCARRQIVTSHAAFGHLAARYGLEQIPLAGLVPEAEPTARAFARLVERVRASGATTVFFETLVSPRIAETVAREANVDTAVLDPLEGLSAEKLAAGEDYFSVMRANLAALRTALGCRA